MIEFIADNQTLTTIVGLFVLVFLNGFWWFLGGYVVHRVNKALQPPKQDDHEASEHDLDDFDRWELDRGKSHLRLIK